ncbi:MAG: Hsp20/alpha crystallin family protein [Deltaproteobacteria bacterium]|nr:Hsp20/alpha crystallin family protein [Deltaproteobacteria bacterium]
MPELILWKNQQINKMKKDLDRLFERVWNEFGVSLVPRGTALGPVMDLSETDDFLLMKVDLPGIDPEDIKISVTDESLIIEGETKQEFEEDDPGHRTRGRRYGFFSRTLRLPCKVLIDDVKATYSQGLLKITMPKCKAESPRKIPIQVQ